MFEITIISLALMFLAKGSLAFTAIFATIVSDWWDQWREQRRNGKWVH